MTKHVPNHPEETIQDHPQRETKVIRGKSSRRRRRPKRHAINMHRANAIVVTNVTTRTRTKQLLQPKMRRKGPGLLHEADIKIIESEMGPDFMTAWPMPSEKDGGGIQACYNQADAQTAMASRGCYTSSVSLWWRIFSSQQLLLAFL